MQVNFRMDPPEASQRNRAILPIDMRGAICPQVFGDARQPEDACERDRM